MGYPKKYRPSEAPTEIVALVDQLVPRLIEGDHPALQTLREQYRSALIRDVELTGVGFFGAFRNRSRLSNYDAAELCWWKRIH